MLASVVTYSLRLFLCFFVFIYLSNGGKDLGFVFFSCGSAYGWGQRLMGKRLLISGG